MSCFHPLKAFQVGTNPETLKPIYKVTSYKTMAIQRVANDHSYSGQYMEYDELPSFEYLKKCLSTKTPVITRSIEIPCGKCIGCRLAYSKEWANRCVLEAKQWKHNYSVTLTYDTEHLPNGPKTEHIIDYDTGELIGKTGATLNPRDVQLFLKRLRKKFGKDIRFFMCGEYGDQRQRPHYHMILFNLELQDVELIGKNKANNPIWKSRTIDQLWGKGLTVIGNVDWEFCAYTARYIMKKQKGPDAEDFYKEQGLVPEFVRMSRRPGIAAKYYEEHKEDIYKADKMYLENRKGVQEVKPARYYDKLYDIEYPEEMKRIKENRRKLAEQAEKVMLSKTTLTKEEVLAIKERSVQLRTKALKRGLESI